MRDEMKPGAVGQGLGESRSVGKRACADGRVIERVDASAVALEQGLHIGGMVLPEFAEGARGLDEGAVRENEDRRIASR